MHGLFFKHKASILHQEQPEGVGRASRAALTRPIGSISEKSHGGTMRRAGISSASAK
jgi:hypothetical protein